MATAVLCLAVSLSSLRGLPVTLLCFPVDPVPSQEAAYVRTIGLAAEAAAADAERHTAEAAAHLYQKQNMASDLATSQKPWYI